VDRKCWEGGGLGCIKILSRRLFGACVVKHENLSLYQIFYQQLPNKIVRFTAYIRNEYMLNINWFWAGNLLSLWVLE
jgi:hypothetical protein